MKTFLFTGWLVALHLALIYALFNTSLLSELSGRTSAANIGNTELTYHYHQSVKAHTGIDYFVEEGSAIFIGDSITEGLNTNMVFQPSVNFGISMDTTRGVYERLDVYSSLSKASVIVLAVGINDLIHRTAEAALGNYNQILKKLPASVPILVSAILPVDENVGWVGFNEKVLTMNTGLKMMTEQKANFFFINPGDYLVSDDGNLSSQYHTDGIHLNKKGYEIWISRLKKAFSEMGVKASSL